MPDTTLKLTLVIGIEGNPHAQHDIGANPCVRNKTEGNPRARCDIGANPHDRHNIGAKPCVLLDIIDNSRAWHDIGGNPCARHDIGGNPPLRVYTTMPAMEPRSVYTMSGIVSYSIFTLFHLRKK